MPALRFAPLLPPGHRLYPFRNLCSAVALTHDANGNGGTIVVHACTRECVCLCVHHLVVTLSGVRARACVCLRNVC